MSGTIRRTWALTLLAVLFYLSSTPSFAALDEEISKEDLLLANKSFTGDYDEMVKRNLIRILVPYNRLFFFFIGAQEKGISYEIGVQFEDFINKKLKSQTIKVKVIFVPTPREKLISQLKEGFGDIAIGNLTITDERAKLIDFSAPFARDVNEILVSHKSHTPISSQQQLSGLEIHVRKSSSYYESLQNLNGLFSSIEKKPIKIVAAHENLEDSDLLEMVNANIIPAIIIDEHKANLWEQVFKDIRLHKEAKANRGGRIAWAIRKNNPKLKQVINEFTKHAKQGSLLGNVIINRYLKDAKYITNSTQDAELKRFQKTIKYFKKYGQEYDFDHLLLTALAFQESKLNQSLKSNAGAVGIMQVLPSTAKDKNVGISSIEKIDPNIHAGTKYLRFLADRYFPPEKGLDPLNRAFFTFASYNAGPAKVTKLRKEAEKMGLNPNIWFNNVEVVAAKRIGRETVQYVSNILKYYVSYTLLSEKLEAPETDPEITK